MSSVLYEGRARLSEIADIPGMSDESWKTRLADGIKANGKSKREVSLAAGMGPGYVHSILAEGKDPTVDNLLRVCEAAGISLYYVLYGVKMDPETEAIVRQLQSSSPAKRRGLLDFLRDEHTEEAPSS
jgi:hypothetical protein